MLLFLFVFFPLAVKVLRYKKSQGHNPNKGLEEGIVT